MWIRNLVRKKSVLQQFHEIFQKFKASLVCKETLTSYVRGRCMLAVLASSRAAKILPNDSWSLYWETSKDSTTQVLTHPQSRMSGTFTNHRKSCKIHLVSKTKACTYYCSTMYYWTSLLTWTILTPSPLSCPSSWLAKSSVHLCAKTYTWDKCQWSR